MLHKKRRVRLNIIMPFTPFHFGPSACIALPFNKKIDLPVFILVNVAIDLETLITMVFNLSYPFHGYAHTFLGATAIGIIWGLTAFSFRQFIGRLMKIVRLSYATTLRKCIYSAILGGWLHVLLDAPLYTDIRPFYPLNHNPLYGIVSVSWMYLICTAAFVPATGFYYYSLRRKNDKINRNP